MKKVLYLLFTITLLSSCNSGKSNQHEYKKVARIEPTCTEKGVKFHYHCDHCNKNFVLDSDGYYVEATEKSLSIAALGHYFFGGEVSHERDGETATATVKCSHTGCNVTQSQTKTVSRTSNSATCEECGEYKYIFNFAAEYGGQWIDTEESGPRGHYYKDVTYNWSTDFSTCTATGYCEACYRTITETVNSTYVIDTFLTDSTPEKGHFIASFGKFSSVETEKNSYDKYGDHGFTPISISISQNSTKTEYASGEAFDKTGLKVYLNYLNGCRTLIDNDLISVSYQNGGNCLLSSDYYVTLTYEDFSTKENITVSKKLNNINSKDVYFMECGDQLNLSDISVTDGTYSYKIFDRNNVEVNKEDLNCGDYKLRVTSSEQGEYSSSTKDIPLKVIHHCDEDGLCIHCKEKVFGSAYYDYSSSKLILENNIEETKFISDNPTVTDIYGNAYVISSSDVGTTKSFLLKRDNSAVIVDIPVITKVINTIEEFRQTLFVPYESYSKTIPTIEGSYILGCDIDASGSDVYKTDNDVGIQWALPDSYKTKGFIGKFDGNGHKISNLVLSSNGYGGLFGLVGTGAQIKNLKLENTIFPTGQWWKYSSLCYVASGATFENVDISYSQYANYEGQGASVQSRTMGIVAGYSIEDNCSFKNVTVNAKNLKIGAAIANRVSTNAKFENFNVICSDLEYLGNNLEKSITQAKELEGFPKGVLVRDKIVKGNGELFIENGSLKYTKAYYLSGNQHAKKASDYFVSKVKQCSQSYSITSNSYNSTTSFSNESKCIVFCDESKIANLGFAKTYQYVNNGDYIYVPDSNIIYIYANGEAGYNLGCLDLLENLFGFDSYFDEVRFLMDGTVNLDVDAKLGHASFAIRMDDGSSYQNQTDQNYGEGFYSSTPFNFANSTGYYHNSYTYLPPETYKGSHSKWYSSKTISNNESTSTSPILGQLCYTAHGDANEYKQMVKTAGDYLFNYVKQVDGKANNNIMFGIQDNTNECTCSACTSYKNSHGGAASAAYVNFANDLINYIRNDKECDIDFKLVIFAYHPTVKAPTNITLNKDIAVMYAPIESDYQVSLDSSTNATYKQNIDAWAKLTDNLFTWIYCVDYSFYLYAHNVFDSMQPTYKYLEKSGVKLIYDEDQHNINQNSRTGFSRLKHYLRGKLTRNTDVDMNELTNNFFENYYYEAAPYMKQFYNSWIARNRIQYKTQMNGGGYAYYKGRKVSNYHNVSWRYDLINWDLNEVREWISLCDSALEEIEKYKTKNTTLYNKLVNRIKVETIFPRWVLLTLDYKNSSQDAASFKTDCNSLGITRVSESDSCPMDGGAGNGLLSWWYNKWGV